MSETTPSAASVTVLAELSCEAASGVGDDALGGVGNGACGAVLRGGIRDVGDDALGGVGNGACGAVLRGGVRDVGDDALGGVGNGRVGGVGSGACGAVLRGGTGGGVSGVRGGVGNGRVGGVGGVLAELSCEAVLEAASVAFVAASVTVLVALLAAVACWVTVDGAFVRDDVSAELAGSWARAEGAMSSARTSVRKPHEKARKLSLRSAHSSPDWFRLSHSAHPFVPSLCP